MSGALGLVAAFAGFACLVYAAKGSHGTQWDGKITPGPVLGQLLLGNWPYTGQAQGQSSGVVPYGQPLPSPSLASGSPSPSGGALV